MNPACGRGVLGGDEPSNRLGVKLDGSPGAACSIETEALTAATTANSRKMGDRKPHILDGGRGCVGGGHATRVAESQGATPGGASPERRTNGPAIFTQVVQLSGAVEQANLVHLVVGLQAIEGRRQRDGQNGGLWGCDYVRQGGSFKSGSC